jgi:hypothetical protein
VRQRTCDVRPHRRARPPPLDAVKERAFAHGEACGVAAAGEAGGGEGVGDAGGGLGEATGEGEGEGDGEGLGTSEGDGDGEGEPDGDALGEAEALGVALQPPARKMYWVSWPLQPRVMPEGCEYQLCMFAGSELTKRFITLLPTCSPYAVMRPPPPLGAVLPTHTPATMSGL